METIKNIGHLSRMEHCAAKIEASDEWWLKKIEVSSPPILF